MLYLFSIGNVWLSVWRFIDAYLLKVSLTHVHLVDWKQKRCESGTPAWSRNKFDIDGGNCW
jgi:hypothetical protein